MCDPKIMEHAIASHQQIRQAVMLGDGKDFPVLLLKLNSSIPMSAADEGRVIEELWPIVDETNKFYRTNSGVSKSAIIIVDPARPLPVAAKGTVQRGPTLELYKNELSRIWG